MDPRFVVVGTCVGCMVLLSRLWRLPQENLTLQARWDGLLWLAAAPFLFLATPWPPLALVWAGVLPAGSLIIASRTQQRIWPISPLSFAVAILTLLLMLGWATSLDPTISLSKGCNIVLGVMAWRWIVLHTRSVHGATAIFGIVGLGFALLATVTTSWPLKIAAFAPLVKTLPGPLPLPGLVDSVHPNQTAGFLILLLPLIPALWLLRTQRRWRTVVAALGTLLLLLLILTQSRSGWLGFGAAVVCWGWLRARREATSQRQIMIVLLGGFLLLTLATALAVPWLRETIQRPEGAITSGSFRLEIWFWGLEAIRDFSWSGVGLGAFRAVLPRLYPTVIPPDYDVAHAHNLWLQVALDAGIPGLVAYLALIWQGARVAWRGLGHRATWGVAAGCCAALIALHVYGLTDTTALGARTGLLFWLLLAVCACVDRSPDFHDLSTASMPERMTISRG